MAKVPSKKLCITVQICAVILQRAFSPQNRRNSGHTPAGFIHCFRAVRGGFIAFGAYEFAAARCQKRVNRKRDASQKKKLYIPGKGKGN
ncbi:hypothetical protein AIQ94_15335 [Salmonella enterica]|nr:hypothetical protein [Salmonella enterica]